MPIIVKKQGNKYLAIVEHKHQGIFWYSQEPLSSAVLVKKLLSLGCYQQDIGDAFNEADPDWVTRKNDEQT